MSKSAEAFRTISEVAELLDTPTHVLRFWESRFPQIRPVKRAGGRRYYRPDDVALLAGIRHMLRQEGMTIRGVQQLIKTEGPRHVMALGGYDESSPGDNEAAEDMGAPPTAPAAAAEAAVWAQMQPDALDAERFEAEAPTDPACEAPESAASPFPADPGDTPADTAATGWPADPEDWEPAELPPSELPPEDQMPEDEASADWGPDTSAPEAWETAPDEPGAEPSAALPEAPAADLVDTPPDAAALPPAPPAWAAASEPAPWISAELETGFEASFEAAEPPEDAAEEPPEDIAEDTPEATTGATTLLPDPEAHGVTGSAEAGFWPADPEDAPEVPETAPEADTKGGTGGDSEADTGAEAAPEAPLEAPKPAVPAWRQGSLFDAVFDPEGEAPMALDVEPDDLIEPDSAAIVALYPARPEAAGAPAIAAQDADPEAAQAPPETAAGNRPETDAPVQDPDAEPATDPTTEPTAEPAPVDAPDQDPPETAQAAIADEAEDAADPAPASGAEPEPEPEPDSAPTPPAPPPVTLPERLRALDPAALSALERVRLIGLRDRLAALRGRIEAPVPGAPAGGAAGPEA